jgi:hypothetical protein
VVYGRVDRRPLGPGPAGSRSGYIVAVGDSGEIARRVGEGTRVIATAGGMVTPGFMDGHLHFVDGGFQLASVDLRPADSPEDFIARLAAYAAEKQPGEWITGGDWDHERWPGTPLPRREWIDSVTPNNPVFVYRLDGHLGLANRAALRAAQVSRATRDIAGGVIPRSPHRRAHRHPRDEAMGPVYGVLPSPTGEQRDRALRRAMEHAVFQESPPSPTRALGDLTSRRACEPAPHHPRGPLLPLQDWKRGRHGGEDRPRRPGLDRRGEGVRGRLARLDHGALLRAL